MAQDNKNPSEIPTRRGVYLRNPSAPQKSTAESVAPKKAESAPVRSGSNVAKVNAVRGTGSAPTVQSAPKADVRASGKSTASRPAVDNRGGSTVKQVSAKQGSAPVKKAPAGKKSSPAPRKKTPAELSREKAIADAENKLKATLEEEMKLTEKLKADHRRREIQKLKDKAYEITVTAIPGIIVGVVVALLIVFAYYRSISKYSRDEIAFAVRGFEYLDEASEDKKVIEKIEKRKKGDEKPILSLDKDILIRDGAPYVAYSDIEEYFDLSVAGDSKSRTVIIGSSDTVYGGKDTAEFTYGSSEISVNGSAHQLACAPFSLSGELYIPFEFVEVFVKGITIDKRTDKNKTIVSMTKTEPNVYLTGSSNKEILTPDIKDYTNDSSAQHEYTVDLSKYGKSINPSNPDIYLTLVSISSPLSEDYVPDDLINVETSDDRPIQQMRYDAGMAMTALLTAAKAAGYSDITVNSGYRSYLHQSSLYNQKLLVNMRKYDEETARAVTSETVMLPGASEHQSGLCADIHNMPTAMQSFANTDEYKWLLEHCADFGFILRYPQTKEAVTGVKFEPWHFRFVGRTHAQKIMSSGMCLEEYLLTLEKSE